MNGCVRWPEPVKWLRSKSGAEDARSPDASQASSAFGGREASGVRLIYRRFECLVHSWCEELLGARIGTKAFQSVMQTGLYCPKRDVDGFSDFCE